MQKCRTIELSNYRIVGLSIRIQITTVLFFDLGKVQKIEFYNFQVFFTMILYFFYGLFELCSPNKYLSQVTYHVVIIVNVLQ